MRQVVTRIDRKAIATKRNTKAVAANEKSIEALPLDSGAWKVRGIPGLYLRCRATVRSFYIARRINGRLTRTVLGQMSLKEARTEAMREWGRLKPAPSSGRKTFGQAFEEFLSQKELSAKTVEIYTENLRRHLSSWTGRALEDLGKDRAGVRALYYHIAKRSGVATASQVIRMFSAVYRYARKVDSDLPESPTVAVSLPATKSREWALTPDQLKAWWSSVEADDEGKETARGVKSLGPIKRAWWLTTLLTGARRGSVEAMRWADVDFDKKIIRFAVAKGDRRYAIPMADKLADLLTKYKSSSDVVPSEWVFPSPQKEDHHIVGVRDDKRGVQSAHHLRHTYRTTLAQLGASSDQARLLLGHAMGGDVSRGYISSTAPLLLESLRPLSNAVADYFVGILGDLQT